MKRKNWFRKVLMFPVYLYRWCISPILPHSCIFYPSCSKYMLQAVEEFGFFKGVHLGTKRIFRCVPWQKKRGYDPIPINIKGENIWIL